MREETQHLVDVCPYCNQPVTPEQMPCKRLASGRRAHLVCYIDHMDEEENELGR